MAFPQYLAMTGAEYANAPVHPPHLGWMALHFSAYGTGLSNFPPTLPENAMLLVNDRTPISGHDPHLISQQLQQITQEQNCACVLLDFQRPGCLETQAVVEAVLHTLSCPVGVSEHYANGVSSPVFLPPVPLRTPISEHLAPWKDREIWLDLSYGHGLIPSPVAQQIVEKHTPDRLLFASDMPWHRPVWELSLIHSLDLDESDREKILFRNAQKLLDI